MFNLVRVNAFPLFSYKVRLYIDSCIQNEPKIQRDDLVNPFWIVDKDLKKGLVRYLDNNETNFWQKLIEKYLYPLNHDKVCVELSNPTVVLLGLNTSVAFLVHLGKSATLFSFAATWIENETRFTNAAEQRSFPVLHAQLPVAIYHFPVASGARSTQGMKTGCYMTI